MEIIEQYECKKRVNGSFHIYVKLIVIHEGNYYVCKWQNRHQPPTHWAQLEDVKRVPVENRGPLLKPDWLIAKEESQHYIKKPSIEDFMDAGLERRMEHEIEMCQLVNQLHHPNLALYHGCLASQDRALGLIFEKYETTLLAKVNSKRLSKGDFIASGRSLVDNSMERWLELVRQALEYLHKNGLAHNDITPSNIMLDRHDTPVVIDFGSLCHLGQSLQHAKRTYGWYDETQTKASEDNDLMALEELRIWLFGSVEELRFPG